MVNTCFPSGYGVSVIITVSRNYLPTWAAFYICSSFLNSSWLPWAEPLHMCCCSSLQRNTNIFCNISFETWNWYSPDSTWFICHCCSLCNLFNVVSCDLRITTSNLWILLAHYWVNVWSFMPKYNVNEKKKKVRWGIEEWSSCAIFQIRLSGRRIGGHSTRGLTKCWTNLGKYVKEECFCLRQQQVERPQYSNILGMWLEL
jgi:hypothetical protein